MATSTRRRREFGRIDRLPSGRYRARYTAADGTRRAAPLTFATRSEADAYLARLRGELLTGARPLEAASRVTLGQYLPAYLRTAAPQLRPRTQDLYRRLAARWILVPVGTGALRVDLSEVPLANLSPGIVRDWHAAVLEASRQAATARAERASSRPARRAHVARAWARAHGLEVAASGRLSPAVLEAWQAAGSPEPGPAPSPAEVAPNAGATAAAQAYCLLRTVLGQAVADGHLAANPCKIKGAGSAQHRERMPLDPAQVAALAEAIAPRYRAAVLVAAWSGLRPGEVFALRRCDVDTDAATVDVHRALVELPGQPLTFGDVKSRASRRTVTLPRTVARDLAAHLERYTGLGPDALIFTTSSGAPLAGATRSRALRPAREAIGRPDLTWHHLRHTGATLAAIAGATQAELQRRIGHSTTRAAAIYQHARDDRDQWIADQLDTLAAGPAPRSPEPPSPAPTTPEPSTPEPAPHARPLRRGHLSLVRSA